MAGLKDLVVFKSLRVASLKVEPTRVSAVYQVQKLDGSLSENVMMYSYTDVIFDKNDSSDINMASLMVAQVAMNYGLFCQEMIFEGLFDDVDKKLIVAMTENTCREIYVNKFLSPNEFLTGPFQNMQPEKRTKYTAAQIKFVDPTGGTMQIIRKASNPNPNQYAILSSGGKDSLLSYGLLNEIGVAHPVFVNESGRHWYTAYNAFHHFEQIEKRTTKVWCNSDRIFNWMVKHMPFIRENFQQIRADIYPIRLWTVAVFLFGVLPVARRRNLKHVIIGNEYDTTLQMQHEGITHYAALYDQSKFFDNAFTRYYHRKGWNMMQFSLLRSLSELLILKILVKRYPDLQRFQVSCHAAHKEGDRMVPCGNCEKCRRIIGMLKVLGADPKNCGYTEDQVRRGLLSLETKKVKQIGSDAQHLYYLLRALELISDLPAVRKMAKPHPEILHLRFDHERSRVEDLPMDIRRPLFDILVQYATGIVQRRDRKWETITLEKLQMESVPYFLKTKHE